MSIVAREWPGLWSWAFTLYGSPTELYVRTASAPAVISSTTGTRQGCPLGAQFFAVGLHPTLLAIASIVGHRGVVVAYADDVHILCPRAVAAER